ncbi:MAG TPA: hypothetical protein DCP69_04520 [Candidatus Omnitrophica bacterium]|nr:hypothetical protein [Candidatus Omnitrophota bacterium]
MSAFTGTYAVVDGQVRKVSDSIPTLARPVYFNKGGVPSYDPSAKRTFQSKLEKRSWLKKYGLREGGIVVPGKRWDGPTHKATKLSWEKKQAHRQRQAFIQARGGVNGLLDRIQRKEGIYV